MNRSILHERRSGVLLHPTSLPGSYAVGDIGPAAHRFIDYLASAGQGWWQMLPVGPLGGGHSPYDSPSAFAGNPTLISLESLRDDGLLSTEELSSLPPAPAPHRADYGAAVANREPLLRRAYDAFARGVTPPLGQDYDRFVDWNRHWVWDYALFSAVKARRGFTPWFQWEDDLRRRDHQALERAHAELRDEVLYRVFLQFIFARQWMALRQYAHEQDVHLMGDVPMFVSHDSVDVWANQHMFFLDQAGERTVQAGVPPDYFSAEGQLWGNPLYRWDVMRRDGYGWWIDRLRRSLERFDALRIDHFIGLCRYWEVEVGAPDAKGGRYVPVPGHHFFEVAGEKLGGVPFVAEDLGTVTDEVRALRDRFGMPGMKVLQFAFAPGAELYLPHRHVESSLVYTGTHDNDTIVGFYDSLRRKAHDDAVELEKREAAQLELRRVDQYVGLDTVPDNETHWAFIRLAYESVANIAIIPVQDVLGLPTTARMNVPGTADGNWTFRLLPGQLDEKTARRLRDLSELTERC